MRDRHLAQELAARQTLPDCPGQGRLFDETSDEGLTQATAGDELEAVLAGLLPGGAPEPAPRKARPHGRRRPAKDLETIDVVHDIADEIKALFAEGELQPLPDVITYQYDFRPGQVILLRHIQRKYLRRDVDSGKRNSEQPLAQDHPAVVTESTPADTEQAVGGDDDTELTSQPTVELTTDTTTDTTTDATTDTTAEVTTDTKVDTAPPTSATSAACDPATTPVGRSDDRQRKRQLPPILLGEKRLAMSSCLAGSGLLAFVWLSKFGDHLPLYRQETITRRFGIPWRLTLCQWMLDLAETLKELHQVMITEVLRSRVLHTDDTTVPRQDVETGKWSTARFWNYVGDEVYPLTVFQYTLTHERTHPATFLRNYQGYVQADAYNGYDGIYLDSGGKIIEVGCWQHARKRFKTAQASDLRAEVALAFIKSMYAIEKRIRERKARVGRAVDRRACRTCAADATRRDRSLAEQLGYLAATDQWQCAAQERSGRCDPLHA